MRRHFYNFNIVLYPTIITINIYKTVAKEPIIREFILGLGVKIAISVNNNEISAMRITNILLDIIEIFDLGIHEIQAGINRIKQKPKALRKSIKYCI